MDVIGAKKASFLHYRLSSTAHIPDSVLSLMRKGFRQTLPDQKDIQGKSLLRKSHKVLVLKLGRPSKKTPCRKNLREWVLEVREVKSEMKIWFTHFEK